MYFKYPNNSIKFTYHFINNNSKLIFQKRKIYFHFCWKFLETIYYTRFLLLKLLDIKGLDFRQFDLKIELCYHVFAYCVSFTFIIRCKFLAEKQLSSFFFYVLSKDLIKINEFHWNLDLKVISGSSYTPLL